MVFYQSTFRITNFLDCKSLFRRIKRFEGVNGKLSLIKKDRDGQKSLSKGILDLGGSEGSILYGGNQVLVKFKICRI